MVPSRRLTALHIPLIVTLGAATVLFPPLQMRKLKLTEFDFLKDTGLGSHGEIPTRQAGAQTTVLTLRQLLFTEVCERHA